MSIAETYWKVIEKVRAKSRSGDIQPLGYNERPNLTPAQIQWAYQCFGIKKRIVVLSVSPQMKEDILKNLDRLRLVVRCKDATSRIERVQNCVFEELEPPGEEEIVSIDGMTPHKT